MSRLSGSNRDGQQQSSGIGRTGCLPAKKDHEYTPNDVRRIRTPTVVYPHMKLLGIVQGCPVFSRLNLSFLARVLAGGLGQLRLTSDALKVSTDETTL
mmetsp:Transcript_9015/g.13173  ORF Transcript_9015/g.13173 Transcript_9015/m.13173 type:complete len:98 (+) Transcript_9015:495-788(+)